MGYLVLLVVVLAACVIVARTWQRRRRDEIRSIHHYHDRLDSLHVEQHDRGGSVRVVHGEPEAHAVDAPNRPKLDPDAAHLDTAAPYASQVERRRRHDRDWAIERMQPRARVDTATVVVITVVVIVLVAIAVAGYLIQHGRGSAPTTTTTTTTTTTHRATTTSSRALIPAGSRSQALQSARRIDPTASATRHETVAFVWSSGNSGVQSTTATPLSASSSTSTIRTVALADAAAHELD